MSVYMEQEGCSGSNGTQEMTSIRVLHVLTTNQRRGAESFAYLLAHRLQEHGFENLAVALLAAGSEPRLPVPPLGTTRALGPRTLRQLSRRMADADVVVAHGSRTLPATALARGRGSVPIVYVNIGDPLYWAHSRARHWRVTQLLRRVQAVAALTGSSARVLHEKFGVPEEKISVISNARSAEEFRPPSEQERSAARKRLALPGDATIIGMVGALMPEKRIDVAIEAIGRLDHSVHLVLAGDGVLRTTLTGMAERRAPGRIHFLGQVKHADWVYHACDAVALTSDSEGVPGVLIEAGMSGIPVVATDVGFVRDVVQEGVTGELVPAGDSAKVATALCRVVASRNRMGSAARAHCANAFDVETVVERWVELLERVAA